MHSCATNLRSHVGLLKPFGCDSGIHLHTSAASDPRQARLGVCSLCGVHASLLTLYLGCTVCVYVWGVGSAVQSAATERAVVYASYMHIICGV